MSKILDVIASETMGRSFKTYKYGLDSVRMPGFRYDDNAEIVWERFGETAKERKSIDLTKRAECIQGYAPIFTYFLDGSRRTYKVDDISYQNQVFPVIAGQVGVGCCKRKNKKMKRESLESRLVITLPKDASSSDWNRMLFFSNLLTKVNQQSSLTRRNLQFSDIKGYNYNKDELHKLEDKGIAVIQELMMESEKNMVAGLVKNNKLNHKNYLLKDGSLEYRVLNLKSKRELERYRQNYRWVVGVSKSFNPANCVDRHNRIISNRIAQLPLFHRTSADMYNNPRIGDVKFAVWYVRIRAPRYTTSAFDGILKIEKMLVTEQELENGIETDEANAITANIINERNPVCYGTDFRWTNHLYPIHITEMMVKSNYLSTKMFLNLF